MAAHIDLMTLKALPFAMLLALAVTPALVGPALAGTSVWTAQGAAVPPKAPALKDAPLPAMHGYLTLRDVVVARYAEEPAASGMFRFFRKMTVVDKQLTDRELYIPWLSRDEALPKVGAHCDIRYHMGPVGGVLKPDATDSGNDSRIMDDFVCKPVGKT